MVQMGGHFDKVMVMIDDMIALLRKEEASDIVHRDMCENSMNANKNEIADLEHQIKKINQMLKRMGNTKTELEEEIEKLEGDISTTKKNQKDMLDMRNTESDDFKQALKDDTDAVALIREAITALSKFYKNNKIAFVQQKAPEYAEDPDKAPESSSFSSDSGGRKSETGGILAILDMLAEDLEKEIADGRKDDAEAQEEYMKQNGALQKTLDAQEETKVGLEEEKASLEEKIDAAEEFKKGQTDDKDAEGDTKKALLTDCKWVKTHFESRGEKRKTEMQGLVDAKGFLAGVDSGDDPLPP
jgi:phage shock protein A